MTKNIFSEFNNDKTVIIITSYPEKGVRYSQKVCAAGGFTKNLVDSVSKLSPSKKTVIITTAINNLEQTYIEDNRLILRIIKRNKPLSWLKVLTTILKLNKVHDILISFEFSSFGDIRITLTLPFIFLALFLFAKKLHFLLHQVITDLTYLSGHLGLKPNSLKIKLLNIGLKNFYLFITKISKSVIVLEQAFQSRLPNSSKIISIPHGVDTKIKPMSSMLARQKLKLPKSKKIILYFGYLNWYKGADIFLQTARAASKDHKYKDFYFLAAGGASFTLKEKAHYQHFLNNLNHKAKNLKNFKITGFIKEKEISSFLSASDILVLPYRHFMSSSGPLSLALSFTKPVIFSKALSQYNQSEDFSSSLKETSIDPQKLFFDLNPISLLNCLSFFLESKNSAKLSQFASSLKKKRSFDKIAKSYLSLFHQTTPAYSINLNPKLNQNPNQLDSIAFSK